MSPRRDRAAALASWFTLAAFVLAVAASLYLLVSPAYASGETLFEYEGLSVLAVLVVPVVLPAVALAVRRRRAFLATATTAAVILVLGSLAAAASVGVFYLASALAMSGAAAVAWIRRYSPTTSS